MVDACCDAYELLPERASADPPSSSHRRFGVRENAGIRRFGRQLSRNPRTCRRNHRGLCDESCHRPLLTAVTPVVSKICSGEADVRVFHGPEGMSAAETVGRDPQVRAQEEAVGSKYDEVTVLGLGSIHVGDAHESVHNLFPQQPREERDGRPGGEGDIAAFASTVKQSRSSQVRHEVGQQALNVVVTRRKGLGRVPHSRQGLVGHVLPVKEGRSIKPGYTGEGRLTMNGYHFRRLHSRLPHSAML